jgi:hypothetical protein
VYTTKRHRRNRKNVKGADKVFRKETLDSLAPKILGPSPPTKLEKSYKFKPCYALVIIALIFILACAANTPHIVGKWKEIGKTATLECWKDGTFKAVDNQKMAVKGKYTLTEPGNVRFEIFRQDSPPEIVNGTVSLQGDLLTVTSADGKEIEKYKREKK